LDPAEFLEIHYKGGDAGAQPVAFVGKGITFDSGGISLKAGAGMELMPGDICGTALAIARLTLPINLVVVTPLCENTPGSSANRPADMHVSFFPLTKPQSISSFSGLGCHVPNTADAWLRYLL